MFFKDQTIVKRIFKLKIIFYYIILNFSLDLVR
jgi:hypothetical protein